MGHFTHPATPDLLMHHGACSANTIDLKNISGIMIQIAGDELRKEIFHQPGK
jgi:hypothetical protein